MIDVLEKRASNVASAVRISSQRDYTKRDGSDYLNRNKDVKYSTFAEIYLEKPRDIPAGISCTVCTWRCIPTIDDW